MERIHSWEIPKRAMLVSGLVGLVLVCLLGACKKEQETPAAPVITRISPESALPGAVVSIFGRGFSSNLSDNTVLINEKKVTIQSVVADSVLQILIPADASSGVVQVTVRGIVVDGPLFTVPRNANPPTLTSILPTTVEAGEIITLTGTHFKEGADLSQNIVRISGVKAQVLEGTATTLKVAVPGLPRGSLPVNVTVLGSISNSIPLTISGFAGTLTWIAEPINPTVNHLYVITANSDGSTVSRNAALLPAPLGNVLNGSAKTYDPVAKAFYFSYDSISSGVNKRFTKIRQSSPKITDARIIYTVNTTSQSTDPDLFYQIFGLGISSHTNQLVLVARMNDRGEIGLFSGSGDGTAPLRHIHTLGLDYNEMQSSATVNGQHIFLSSQNFNSSTNLYDYTLKKYPLEPNLPAASFPFLLNNQRIAMTTFNPDDDQIYFLVVEAGDVINATRLGLYQIAGTGSTPKKIADFTNVAGNPRHLTVLTTATGTKVFWVAPTSALTDAIWMLNLRAGQPGNVPVVLYTKPGEVANDPFTRSGYQTGFLMLNKE